MTISTLSSPRYFTDVTARGGWILTSPPDFFAFSCSMGHSEQHFPVAFFILSPTSCRNLRFSCKKCQKQPRIGTKIAKNDFFQKFFQNLNSPSSIQWEQTPHLKKKISKFFSKFSKNAPRYTKNVPKNFFLLFLIYLNNY